MTQINSTTAFKYVNCHSEQISEVIGKDVPHGKFGFHLINDHLVPNNFLDDLEGRFFDVTFDHDQVISIRDIVGDAYIQGLTKAEREVLGACLLLLIEQGRLAIYFMDAKLD